MYNMRRQKKRRKKKSCQCGTAEPGESLSMKSHSHLLHTRSHCVVVYRYSVIGQYFYEYFHIVLCLSSFLYFVFVLSPNGIESYNCFVCYHGPSFFFVQLFSADDSKPVSWPITSGVMLLFINIRLEAKGK